MGIDTKWGFKLPEEDGRAGGEGGGCKHVYGAVAVLARMARCLSVPE